MSGQPMSEATIAANRDSKERLVPIINCIVTSVQEFVRKRRKKQIRTVARHVMLHLLDEGYINVDLDNNLNYNATLQAV